MSKFTRTGGFWLLLIVLFFGAQFFVKRDLISGNPPRIQAQTVTGELFELSHFKGRAALVYFWASWCGICDAMDGTVSKLSKNHPVITVAMQSGGEKEVTAHLRESGVSFPAIADESGEISGRYGVRAVPTFFVLNPLGEIAFSGIGYTTEWGLKLRLWMAEKGLL